MEDILATGFTGTARFRVIRLIGQGGMGVVYEVEDRASGERMALETLHTVSGNALWRLKNELRTLQDLQHENLIHLGELHKEGDFRFFTKELIEGSDFLSYVLSSPGAPAPQPAGAGDTPPPARFDEHRLRQALAQLAAGLGALHAAGKVHRGIKPPSCLITTRGRLVILDFGLITHATHAAHTARGSSSGDHEDLVGTVMYMAPEQAASRAIGPEADLYSVGVMLYEVLTGVLPFSGHALSVLDRKQHMLPPRPVELVPDVPADLDALCMDLLAIQPELRPAAGTLLDRLGRPPMPAGKAASRMHTGSVAAPALVGRTGEIAALERALHDSRHDRAVSVVLTGESGVGKIQQTSESGNRAPSYSDNMQLEDVLWARIQLLEPHSRTLIELVCVACVKLDQAVAAAALGVGAADLDALVRGLELGHLVRLSGLELGRALEPYHDRVRAAVHANLDEDVRRHHHQVLAECLERYGIAAPASCAAAPPRWPTSSTIPMPTPCSA